MSELLYFDPSALSVVDDWLAEPGDKVQGQAAPRRGQPVAAAAAAAAAAPVAKAGLGYSKPKPGSKGQQDELQGRLAKQADKARKEQSAADGGGAEDEGQELEDDRPQHGMVEDYSLSKSKLMGKKESAAAAAAAAAAIANAPSKKEKKKRAREEAEQQQTRAKQEQEQEQEQGQEQVQQSKRGGYWAQVRAEDKSGGDGDGGGGGDGGDPEKPKRRKTRSKQKNIRKDSRPAELKPNYRPLTAATTSRMLGNQSS